MNKLEAFVFAKDAARRSNTKPPYMVRQNGEFDEVFFKPHPWVVEAVQAAYAAGVADGVASGQPKDKIQGGVIEPVVPATDRREETREGSPTPYADAALAVIAVDRPELLMDMGTVTCRPGRGLSNVAPSDSTEGNQQ